MSCCRMFFPKKLIRKLLSKRVLHCETPMTSFAILGLSRDKENTTKIQGEYTENTRKINRNYRE